MSQPRKADLRRFYVRVAKRAGHRCEYCHAPESFFPHRLCLDHILPEGRGGPTSMGNLALCCYGCQQQKLALRRVWTQPQNTIRRFFIPDASAGPVISDGPQTDSMSKA